MSMTEYKVSDIIWHDDEHTSPDYYWNNRSDTFNGTTLYYDSKLYTFEKGRYIPIWTEV